MDPIPVQTTNLSIKSLLFIHHGRGKIGFGSQIAKFILAIWTIFSSTLISPAASQSHDGSSAAPSNLVKIATINRKFNQGDIFTGVANCSASFCLDLMGFPIASTTGRPNNCNCQCHGHLPAFVEWNHVRQCSNTIEGCNMIPFQSHNARTKTPDHHFLPAIHLPLLTSPGKYPSVNGSVLNPSGAPAWHAQGITQLPDGSADCVVEKVQLLTLNGWRPIQQHHLLFDLYVANRITYIRWLGNRKARAYLGGKIVLINLLCNSTRQTPNYCIAFRVVGIAKLYVIPKVAFPGGSSPSQPVTLALRPSPGQSPSWVTTARSVKNGKGSANLSATNAKEETPNNQLGLIIGVVCGTLLVITLIGAVILWTFCWKKQKAKLVRKVHLQVLLQQRMQHVQEGRPPEFAHHNIPPHHFPHHNPPPLQETFVPTGLEAYQYQMFSPTNPFASSLMWGPGSPPPPNHVLSNSRLHYYSQGGASHDNPDGGRTLRMGRPDRDSEFGNGASGSMSRSFIVNQMQQQQQHQQQQQNFQERQMGGSLSGYPIDSKSTNSSTGPGQAGGSNPPPSVRKKLYFSPEFFEPELMEEPPPIAEEFLNEVRKMIDLAKNRIRSRRYIPSLLVIPEDDRSSTAKRKNSTESLSDIIEEAIEEEHREHQKQLQKTQDMSQYYASRLADFTSSQVQQPSQQLSPVFEMPSGEGMSQFPSSTGSPRIPRSGNSGVGTNDETNSSGAEDSNGEKTVDTNGSGGEDSGLGSDGTPTPPAERGGGSPTRDESSSTPTFDSAMSSSSEFPSGDKSPQMSSNKPKVPPKPPVVFTGGAPAMAASVINGATSNHHNTLSAPSVWHKAQHSPSANHKVTSWLRGMSSRSDSSEDLALEEINECKQESPSAPLSPKSLRVPLYEQQHPANSAKGSDFNNCINTKLDSDNPVLRLAVDGSINRSSKPKGILKGYSNRKSDESRDDRLSENSSSNPNLSDSHGATMSNGLFTGNKLTVPPIASFPSRSEDGDKSCASLDPRQFNNSPNSTSNNINSSKAQTLPYAKCLLKQYNNKGGGKRSVPTGDIVPLQNGNFDDSSPTGSDYSHRLANDNNQFRYATTPLSLQKHSSQDHHFNGGSHTFGSLPRYFIRQTYDPHSSPDDDNLGLPPPPSYADSFPSRGHPTSSGGHPNANPRPSIHQNLSLFNRASHSTGAQQPLSVSTEGR